MEVVTAIFTVFGEFAKTLGFSGMAWAIAGLLLAGLFVRFLDRFGKHWRRSPAWRKQAYVAFVLLFGWPVVWQLFPKTTGGLALIIAASLVWYFGGWAHLRRFGMLDSTPTQGWLRYFSSRIDQRSLTQVHDKASTKSGGRARRPVRDNGRLVVPFEPHDGQSQAELAEDINEGRYDAAIKRHTGVNGRATATPMPDGTVQAVVAPEEETPDLVAETRWWDGR